LKEELIRAKKVIINGLDLCLENPSIFEKYSWLKKQYNELIILGDNIKDPIRELNEGISGGNIHYSYTDDFYTNHQKNLEHNSENEVPLVTHNYKDFKEITGLEVIHEETE